MKTNRRILLITLLLLFLVGMSCFYFVNYHNLKMNRIKDEMIENIKDSYIKNIVNSSKISRSFNCNYEYIFSKTKMKPPILIYRYPMNMCYTCLQQDLSTLLDLQSIIGKERILIFPSFEYTRDNVIKMNNELHKFNYVNISIDTLIIPLNQDGIRQRYFALINKDQSIDMVFFPNRKDEDLTEIYINEVKKMLVY